MRLWQFKKFRSTIRMLYCMGMACTFGRYLHSVGGHNTAPYTIYEWRGKKWWVPTGAVGDL